MQTNAKYFVISRIDAAEEMEFGAGVGLTSLVFERTICECHLIENCGCFLVSARNL